MSRVRIPTVTWTFYQYCVDIVMYYIDTLYHAFFYYNLEYLLYHAVQTQLVIFSNYMEIVCLIYKIKHLHSCDGKIMSKYL